MGDRPSPYGDALTALVTAGVDFVVVGVGGVNFYAIDPATAFVTQDLDLWLRPGVANLRVALTVLSSAGFRFEAGGEPFIDIGDEEILRNAIRTSSNLIARGEEGDRIDLMLGMQGFSFGRVFAGAIVFRIQDVFGPLTSSARATRRSMML